jgi:hypothetical protein
MSKRIGIDLDDTLITTIGSKWNLDEDTFTYLPKIYQDGFELHLITARDEAFRNDVDKILNKVEENLGIEFVTKHFTNGRSKGYCASQAKCLCMIDDNWSYLLDCRLHGVRPVLFTKFKEYKQLPNQSWYVCKSWEEVYKMLQ